MPLPETWERDCKRSLERSQARRAQPPRRERPPFFHGLAMAGLIVGFLLVALGVTMILIILITRGP